MFELNKYDISNIMAFMRFCRNILKATGHVLPKSLGDAVAKFQLISQGIVDHRTKGWQKQISLCVQFLNSFLPAFNYHHCIWTILHVLVEENISHQG